MQHFSQIIWRVALFILNHEECPVVVVLKEISVGVNNANAAGGRVIIMVSAVSEITDKAFLLFVKITKIYCLFVERAMANLVGQTWDLFISERFFLYRLALLRVQAYIMLSMVQVSISACTCIHRY